MTHNTCTLTTERFRDRLDELGFHNSAGGYYLQTTIELTLSALKITLMPNTTIWISEIRGYDSGDKVQLCLKVPYDNHLQTYYLDVNSTLFCKQFNRFFTSIFKPASDDCCEAYRAFRDAISSVEKKEDNVQGICLFVGISITLVVLVLLFGLICLGWMGGSLLVNTIVGIVIAGVLLVVLSCLPDDLEGSISRAIFSKEYETLDSAYEALCDTEQNKVILRKDNQWMNNDDGRIS